MDYHYWTPEDPLKVLSQRSPARSFKTEKEAREWAGEHGHVFTDARNERIFWGDKRPVGYWNDKA